VNVEKIRARAVLIILALVLVLAHPVAFLAVTGGELAMCAGFAWPAWRIIRSGRLYVPWRPA